MRLGGAQVTELPFGACVWATGIAMHPLVKQLQERLAPGTQVRTCPCAHSRCGVVGGRVARRSAVPRSCSSQTHFRSVVTDEYLRVLGGGGALFALGDASTIQQQKASAPGAAAAPSAVLSRRALLPRRLWTRRTSCLTRTIRMGTAG